MSRLPDLFHHRWAAAVLAELQRTSGSRFVTLTNRIGVASESLRRHFLSRVGTTPRAYRDAFRGTRTTAR